MLKVISLTPHSAIVLLLEIYTRGMQKANRIFRITEKDGKKKDRDTVQRRSNGGNVKWLERTKEAYKRIYISRKSNACTIEISIRSKRKARDRSRYKG